MANFKAIFRTHEDATEFCGDKKLPRYIGQGRWEAAIQCRSHEVEILEKKAAKWSAISTEVEMSADEKAYLSGEKKMWSYA